MEADENKALIDRLIKRKMRENSSLCLVPVSKMAAMIDKYVSSNDSHALETFFDHEVFRKSYHELRRSFIDQNANKGQAITDEFEAQLREKVKSYLNYQFGGTTAEADDEEMDPEGTSRFVEGAAQNDAAMLNSIEQATATYASLKRMKYSAANVAASGANNAPAKNPAGVEESPYSKQLGSHTKIAQMMQAMNDANAVELRNNQNEFKQILTGQYSGQVKG